VRLLPTTDRTYLSEERRRQVAVLFEAILPGSESAPGARDCGAADFLDCMLASDESVYFEIPAWRKLYDAAIPALDAISRDRFGKGLDALDVAQATELLSDLRAGQLQLPEGLEGPRVFTTLRGHCIEGCFSNPRWRGNRDSIMWRWIGYPEKPRDFERGPDGDLKEVS
jgi:gluconate 2-dehydrogenase gamma chain